MASGTTHKISAQAQEADAAFEAYRARSRFGNLDGLRFICIFMVLWHHNPMVPSDVMQLFGRGFLGVDFFFVLSGFLITTLLLRETARTGKFSMRNFYIRRLLRIVPVYFFVVTCVALYYIGVDGRTELIRLLPYYYLFLSNFLTEHIPLLTITWSLSVEEQYYMLWPLALLLLPPRFLGPACLILIALNVAGAMGLFGTSPLTFGPLRIALPTATYAPIIMGSLAALWLHKPASFARLYALTSARPTPVLLGLFLIAFLQFGPENVEGLPNLVIHASMTLLLVSLVVREDTLLTPFLTLPFVARVGVVSYGIYLYHLIALDVVMRLSAAMGGLPSGVVLICYSLLAYLVAEISFRTLEAWFQRFRPREGQS